ARAEGYARAALPALPSLSPRPASRILREPPRACGAPSSRAPGALASPLALVSSPSGGRTVELIEIGRLGRPHGLEGEQGLDRCTLTTDELQAIKTFTWRGAGGEHRTLHLVSVRQA